MTELETKLTEALTNLRFESLHYVSTGLGAEFLRIAIANADKVLTPAFVLANGDDHQEESNKAFAEAIKSGRLIVLEGWPNSVVDCMFMGYDTNARAMFKNINTREYVK